MTRVGRARQFAHTLVEWEDDQWESAAAAASAELRDRCLRVIAAGGKRTNPSADCLAPTACAALGPGLCRQCGQRRRFSDPAQRERHRAAVQKRERDPDYRARRDAAASLNGQKAIVSVDRVKAGRTRSLAALGWLRPHLRDEYVRLRREFGAREAKRILLADREPRS